jgi:hypothetical protein
MVPLRPEGKKTPWLLALPPVTMARTCVVVRDQPTALESQSTMVAAVKAPEPVFPFRSTWVVVTPMSSALVPMNVVVVAPEEFAQGGACCRDLLRDAAQSGVPVE